MTETKAEIQSASPASKAGQSQELAAAGTPAASTATPQEIQYFDTKEIEWKGHAGFEGPVRILLQNANGPCPLVALINTMVLSSPATASYTSGKERISVKGLLEYLGELLLEKVSASARGETNEMINDTNDVLRLLPKLVTGLNIDPRFDGQFSNSPEMSLFRLYDVDIVHGWLARPDDPNTKQVIEAESYEHSQMLLVEASEIEARQIARNKESSNEAPIGTPVNDVPKEGTDGFATAEAAAKEALPVSNNIDSQSGNEQPSKLNADIISAPSDDGDSKSPILQSPSSKTFSEDSLSDVPSPKPATATKLFKDILTESCNVPLPPSVPESPASPREGHTLPDAPANYTLPEEALDAAEEQALLQRAHSVRQFLTQYPTQLTEYGIAFLNELLPPGNLAVFFRNDHFSTIYKPRRAGRALMVLVTDSGFARRRNIVWQSLSGIGGENDEFYDSELNVSPLDGQQNAADGRATSDQQHQHHEQTLSEVADFELARQLQEEEDLKMAQAAAAEVPQGPAAQRQPPPSSARQQQQHQGQGQGQKTPRRQHGQPASQKQQQGGLKNKAPKNEKDKCLIC